MRQSTNKSPWCISEDTKEEEFSKDGTKERLKPTFIMDTSTQWSKVCLLLIDLLQPKLSAYWLSDVQKRDRQRAWRCSSAFLIKRYHRTSNNHKLVVIKLIIKLIGFDFPWCDGHLWSNGKFAWCNSSFGFRKGEERTRRNRSRYHCCGSYISFIWHLVSLSRFASLSW